MDFRISESSNFKLKLYLKARVAQILVYTQYWVMFGQLFFRNSIPIGVISAE